MREKKKHSSEKRYTKKIDCCFCDAAAAVVAADIVSSDI
jgi:hypothetical protein